MVNGRGAFLPEDDPMAKEPYIVCCELDDRAGDAKVFLGCPISEDEILELFGNQIVEESYCEWDRRTDSVKCVLRGKLGELPLYEKPQNGAEGAQGALLEGVRIKGVDNLPCWGKESLQMRARINFLNRVGEGWPKIEEQTVLSALVGFVGGMMKWRDLEKLDIAAVMEFIARHGCESYTRAGDRLLCRMNEQDLQKECADFLNEKGDA